jgi:hypothetical protein
MVELKRMDESNGERRFGELTICGSCGRSTSAGRPKCLYCGTPMAGATPSSEKLAFQAAESWENGFNVSVFPLLSRNGEIAAAASIIEIDAAVLDKLLSSDRPVPFFRTSDRGSADKLKEELRKVGFVSEIVADTDLELRKPNIRLRGIRIGSGRIILEHFNGATVSDIALSDMALLVSGRIRETQVESFQKRPILGAAKTSGESSVSGDDPVLDLYSTGSDTGFRIVPAGFDFSCLGSEKGAMARENWSRLIQMLSEKLPAVRSDLEFDQLNRSLEVVWPETRRVEAKGLTKTGFGKREFGRGELVSNAEQFLRHSRLRWYFHEK